MEYIFVLLCFSLIIKHVGIIGYEYLATKENLQSFKLKQATISFSTIIWYRNKISYDLS